MMFFGRRRPPGFRALPPFAVWVVGVCAAWGMCEVPASGQEFAGRPSLAASFGAELPAEDAVPGTSAVPVPAPLPAGYPPRKSEPELTLTLGGFVKADLLHDFSPIDSTDSFNPTTIPTDGLAGQNTRLHARQTRLNVTALRPVEGGDLKIFVEGDFFGDRNAFRLRHAYGEHGPWLIGQTWTTFTLIEALPPTLDFETPIAFILLRQTQIRWTHALDERWSFAGALENPETVFEPTDIPPGDPLQPWPHGVVRIRRTDDWGQLQLAAVMQDLAYRDPAGDIQNVFGWGVNVSGWAQATERDKLFVQWGVGDGSGSYRGNANAVVENGRLRSLGSLGWTVGWEHRYAETLRGDVVFSHGAIDKPPGVPPRAFAASDYLAVNLIWTPLRKVDCGVEYLYGTRTDQDGRRGDAHRVQAAVWYYLR